MTTKTTTTENPLMEALITGRRKVLRIEKFETFRRRLTLCMRPKKVVAGLVQYLSWNLIFPGKPTVKKLQDILKIKTKNLRRKTSPNKP